MSQYPVASNVVRFTSGRRAATPWRDQKSLLDAVYAAGSLPVGAEDRDTKRMSARLQILGFLVVEEIRADGSARRMSPSETIRCDTARPWRIARPSLGASERCLQPAAL